MLASFFMGNPMEIIQNQILILQFGSESCAPCKALQNRIKAWNQEHPAVEHVYVTADERPEPCTQMGVFTVPAIFVYVEGKLAIERSGYFSLEQMLAQVRNTSICLQGKIKIRGNL